MPATFLFEFSRRFRFGLWISFILLTAGIVLFPVAIHYEYQPLESADAFGNLLPVFAVVFYTWMAVLFLLLFSKNDIGEWQRAALLSLLAIGMVGLWVANTPYGGHPDELWQMGHVKYLMENGRIDPNHPVFNYFQFPGFHILLASLTIVTGSSIFGMRLLYMLFSGVAFALLSYLLLFRMLKNTRSASLGVLLLFLGCPLVASAEISFWPGNLAQLLFVALLLLLAWRQESMRWILFTLLFVVFFAGLTIIYLPTSVFFLFVLAAIYLLQRINKTRAVPIILVILVLAMFVTWQFFNANSTLMNAIQGLTTTAATETPATTVTSPTPIKQTPRPPAAGTVPAAKTPAATAEPESAVPAAFSGLNSRLSVVLELGAVFIGTGAPPWVSVTKLLWLVLIFAVGGILGIRNLFRITKLDAMETIETGGMIGVVIFTPVAFFMSSSGEQTARFFVYTPFFIIPMILRFLIRPAEDNGLPERRHKPIGWFRKNYFSLLVILAFLSSLPNFLANAGRVLSHPIYAQENAAGEFLQAEYGDSKLSLYSTPFVVIFYSYYVPDASFRVLWPSPDPGAGKQGFWQAMEPLLDDFESSKDANAIFVVSRRLPVSYGPTVIIAPDDPEWLAFINRLERNDKIYDNGFVQLYRHRVEQESS
jgi:hypothetical protein